MATALVTGLLNRHAATPADLACLGGDDDTAARLSALTGITVHPDLPALLADADLVVLAFKPQHLASADPRLADLTAGKLVLSILAGKPLSSLHAVFPRARNLVRTMPNTPGQIGAGITGWCSLAPLPPLDLTLVTTLLDALGQHLAVPESQIDAITAVSGSGPAYVFEFTAALRAAATAAGLSPEHAHTLALATVIGSAQLMAQSTTDPEELRNQVTSPHGTTHAALERMRALGFRDLLRDAVLAAKHRSEELSTDA